MLVESKTKAEILSVPILQERKGLSDPPGAQTQSIRSAVIYLRSGHEITLSIAPRSGPLSRQRTPNHTVGAISFFLSPCASPPPLEKPKAVLASDHHHHHHLRRSKGRRDFRHTHKNAAKRDLPSRCQPSPGSHAEPRRPRAQKQLDAAHPSKGIISFSPFLSRCLPLSG